MDKYKKAIKVSTTTFVLSSVICGGVIINDFVKNYQRTLLENKKLALENKELKEENDVLKYELNKANETIRQKNKLIDDARKNITALNSTINKLKQDQSVYLDGKTYIVVKEMNILASAYSQSDEEETADGITYMETRVRDNHTIAVDPNVIPLGSIVYIESDSPLVGGFYVAEDIGSAIKGNRIDIFMSDKNKCFEFGKRNVKVTILKPVGGEK